MSGKDQPRDKDGKWAGAGMSDDLAALVDMQRDYFEFNGHGEKEAEIMALESVIRHADEGQDGRFKQRHANEARRVLRQLGKGEMGSLSDHISGIIGKPIKAKTYAEARKKK